MASLDVYRVELGKYDYPPKYDGFLTYMQAADNERIAARQGQADLVTNLGRYLRKDVGLTAALSANGFKITGAADGSASTDYVTLQQLVAAVFSPALPGQAGSKRKGITTDGTTASWAWPVEWDVVDANTNMEPGQACAVRTVTASRVMTLPAGGGSAPFWIKDADYSAGTISIFVDPGAEAFEDGAAGEQMEISSNGGACCIQFINGKYRVTVC